MIKIWFLLNIYNFIKYKLNILENHFVNFKKVRNFLDSKVFGSQKF